MAEEKKRKSTKDLNQEHEDRVIAAQWERAKRDGLLQQGEGLKKTYEHDGLNAERPKGY